MSEKDNELQTFLNKYNLGKVFALGSFSTVKFAKSIKSNENDVEHEYAIKKTPCHKVLPLNPPLMEVEVLKSINHENIVKIVDYHLSATHLYIVMDFIMGRYLHYFIEWSISFPRREIAKMMHDLASALTYLHHLEIVHRDINPRNLIVEVDNDYKVRYLKVIDFSCATYLSRPSLMFNGVIQFCAPELIQLDMYGCNVDVWSAGIVLCYLIFGLEIATFDFASRELNFQFDQCCIPEWFKKSPLLKRLLRGMLDKNGESRYSAYEVLKDKWVLIHTMH